jgi:hypothetical protein
VYLDWLGALFQPLIDPISMDTDVSPVADSRGPQSPGLDFAAQQLRAAFRDRT